MPSSPSNEAYFGFQRPNTDGDDVNRTAFAFFQLMGAVWTSIPVLVKAVTNAGELAPVGFVDVLPMVHQVDGSGQATPHDVINDLPYHRVQGGANAVIIDPEVGDIGMAFFAMRDVSAVKASKTPNVPGSARRYDPADGFYFGGVLNGQPTQYVRFSSSGVEVVSPTQIKLKAPDIQFEGPTHTTGDVTGDKGAVYHDDVVANSVSVDSHVHDGVTTGSGDTGPPT